MRYAHDLRSSGPGGPKSFNHLRRDEVDLWNSFGVLNLVLEGDQGIEMGRPDAELPFARHHPIGSVLQTLDVNRHSTFRRFVVNHYVDLLRVTEGQGRCVPHAVQERCYVEFSS